MSEESVEVIKQKFGGVILYFFYRNKEIKYSKIKVWQRQTIRYHRFGNIALITSYTVLQIEQGKKQKRLIKLN